MNDPVTIVLVVATGFFFVFLFALGFLVVRDTVRGRGRWGMNFRPVNCPRCDEPMPEVRVPKSLNQTLWGGSTCPACGCEVDKWGNEVADRDDN